MSSQAKLRTCYRSVRNIEMYNILECIEEKFKADLNASKRTSSSYDEFSTETYNDYLIASAKIATLHLVELLDEDEYIDIKNYFESIRFDSLSEEKAEEEE